MSFIITIIICLVCLFVAKRIRSAYFSPLSPIPNANRTVPFSRLWSIITKWRGCENRSRFEAHKRLGPVVRIRPNELSIDCIDDGIRTVYSSGFEKDDWYAKAFGDGTPFLITMLSTKSHAERKRMIASPYSKSNIQNSPYLEEIAREIFSGRIRNQLHAWARDNTTVDVLEKSKASMMDFTSTWFYGLGHGSNLLEDGTEAERFFKTFKQSFMGFFWRTEFSKVSKFLQYVGIYIIPKAVGQSQRIIEQWNLTMCQTAHNRKAHELPMLDKAGPIKPPLVYTQLRDGLERSVLPHEQVKAALSRELFDHLTASTEASGTALTYVLHELTQRPSLQRALRSELHQFAASHAESLTHSDIEALPILDAVLKETMRLRTPGPGPWPRRVPAAGCRIESFDNIPPGTVISASSYTLHRNAAVFSKPEEFLPERWLDANAEKLREMMRWYWPFGSGPYGCTGQYFAVRSVKLLIATIYAEFETSVVDDSGMEQIDGVLAGPVGDKLLLKFHNVGYAASA